MMMMPNQLHMFLFARRVWGAWVVVADLDTVYLNYFQLSRELLDFFPVILWGWIMYERIRSLAQARGLSIPALEILANLGQGTISKWRHVSPRADALNRVASILGTTVDYLLNGTENEEDDDIAQYLQDIKDDPSARIMFDLAKGATPQEIRATVAFLKTLREQEATD